MNSLFLHNLAEQIALLQSLQPLDAAVAQAGALATQSLRAGGKLMFCGNGGSAVETRERTEDAAAAVRRGAWIGARSVQVQGDTEGLPTRAELESAKL